MLLMAAGTTDLNMRPLSCMKPNEIKKNGLNVGPMMQRLAIYANNKTTLLKLDFDTRRVFLLRQGQQDTRLTDPCR